MPETLPKPMHPRQHSPPTIWPMVPMNSSPSACSTSSPKMNLPPPHLPSLHTVPPAPADAPTAHSDTPNHGPHDNCCPYSTFPPWRRCAYYSRCPSRTRRSYTWRVGIVGRCRIVARKTRDASCWLNEMRVDWWEGKRKGMARWC